MQDEHVSTDLSITAEIKLYYDLYVPPGTDEPLPLLIAVHGYGAHKHYMMREGRGVAGEKFAVASLQAPHQHFRQTESGYRTGFGWLTDTRADESIALHQKFVNDVIARLVDEGVIDPARVVLFGFSQASALNFRYAFTFPETLRGVVAVCGGIPGDLGTKSAYRPFGAETFYLFGDDDEFYSQEQFADFDTRLRKTLPNYRSKHYIAKHEITDEMRIDIRAFLESII